jgi:hypothetical protein
MRQRDGNGTIIVSTAETCQKAVILTNINELEWELVQ